MNFMERRFIWFGVFVLLIGGVFAGLVDDDLGKFNNGDLGNNQNSSENVVFEDSGNGNNNVSEVGKFYTANFYIALIIVLLMLVPVGVFVWLWIRGPRNKWKK